MGKIIINISSGASSTSVIVSAYTAAILISVCSPSAATYKAEINHAFYGQSSGSFEHGITLRSVSYIVVCSGVFKSNAAHDAVQNSSSAHSHGYSSAPVRSHSSVASFLRAHDLYFVETVS